MMSWRVRFGGLYSKTERRFPLFQCSAVRFYWAHEASSSEGSNFSRWLLEDLTMIGEKKADQRKKEGSVRCEVAASS